jgi:iron complex outermembrane receptor protein
VPGSTTFETFYQNVGGVKAYGAELSGQWKPQALGGKIYFNANVSYNVAKFEDNFGTLLIAGNRIPDFPDWLLQTGVTYEPIDGVVLNLSARHISSRFTNYTNSETTDGYTVYNAYADFGKAVSLGPIKQLNARINIDNLTDLRYLGTISAIQVSTPSFFRPGPARTVQVSLSAQF